MPILIFLRQYGLREYAVTLTVAALVGLGIAMLLNSAAGGRAGAPLTTKPEVASASPAVPAPKVVKPAAKAPSAAKARPAHRRHHVRRHHVRRSPVVAARFKSFFLPSSIDFV